MLPVLLVVSLWPAAAIVDPPGPPAGPSRTASLAGRVVDGTGAPLDEVAISLSADVDRAATAHIDATTRPDGRYRIADLTPGRYRVTFRRAGFADVQRATVLRDAGESIVDAVLQVALTSEVTVSASGTFATLAELERPEDSLVGLATAASQGAVTARQLRARPLQRTGELIETVPGLIVSQHSGEGKANQYYLRGFNLDHGTDFATTVAGMPVNLPSHAHGHGYTDLNFVIPELVSGVQFRKGPYGAEDGDFSSAGSASLSYANVLERPILSLSSGQDGWRRLVAAASPRAAGGHLLAAVEASDNDGPWASPDRLAKRSAVVRYSRGAALDGWSLTAMAYDARWHATDQVPERAIRSGALGRFSGLDDTTGGTTSRYSLSAEWQRSDSRRLTRVFGYAIRYGLDLFSNFTYALDDPEHGDQFAQRDRRVIVGGRVTRRERRALFGRAVEHAIGLELRHDAIGEIGLYRTRARLRRSTVREDAIGQTMAGVFGQSEVRLHDRVRAVGGVRVDLLRVDVQARDARNGGRDRSGLVSPKAAVVLGPWRKTEVYLNAGTGFHSNDARGATIAVDPATGLPADRVTPLVRSRGAEIGLRSVLLPRVQTTLAWWRLGLDSELVFVGDAGSTTAGRPSRRHGIEWATVATPARWLTLDGELAWSQASFTDDDPAGPRVPGAVQVVASAAASVHDVGRLSGSLRWRYVGRRPLVEDGTVTSAPTSLVNAAVAFRLTRRVTLQLETFNLFDADASDIEYYYVSRLPGEPAEGIADRHTHPSLPRTVRLGVEVRF